MTEPTTTGAGVDEAPAAPAPEVLHGAPVTDSRGQKVVHPSRADYVKVVKALKPKASRDKSSETFLVGVGLKSRTAAPIS